MLTKIHTQKKFKVKSKLYKKKEKTLIPPTQKKPLQYKKHTIRCLKIKTKNNNQLRNIISLIIKTKKHTLNVNTTYTPIISITPPSSMYGKKIKNTPNSKNKIPNYTFHNKKILLKCGDIESNPGPRPILLLNHPQVHREKQKTYFFNKTIQIKPEYNHILELFKPYLNHTQTTNTNPHLTQFCRNNNHCLESYLFYAILITLAPTPTQFNQLIAKNSTQWTTNLIKILIECPNPLPTDQHKLLKFHSENPHFTKPLESIQKELYSFITTEQPNLAAIQHKFPYLPEKMILEALKCLQPIPSFTDPNPIQNHPPINPQYIPYTNPTTKMLTWNYGTLNIALPGLQS
jgi:hypothetical protein